MAIPPLSVPVTLEAAVLERCVHALAAPPGWAALRADAVEREGRTVLDLLLSGPLGVEPELRFEIPMSVTLDANQNVSSDAREELAHALRSCRRAATNSALAAWAAGLTDRVVRLDAVGDVGRLLCRGLRDGVAAEPLWL